MSRTSLILTCIATLTAVSLLGPLPSAQASPCSGYRCNDTRVSRLFLSADGNVYVRPTDGGQANLTCGQGSSNTNSTYLTLQRAHKSFKEIYTTLLAAKLAGAPVNFRLHATSATCDIMYITLDKP